MRINFGVRAFYCSGTLREGRV